MFLEDQFKTVKSFKRTIETEEAFKNFIENEINKQDGKIKL